jgi:hypothetical protein
MSSIYIIVQPRESDAQAVDLLKHLIEKQDLKVDTPTKDLDPNTVLISFKDVQPDDMKRIVSDSKQWCDDVGFVFFVNEDSVYSSVSPGAAVVKENATIILMIELD